MFQKKNNQNKAKTDLEIQSINKIRDTIIISATFTIVLARIREAKLWTEKQRNIIYLTYCNSDIYASNHQNKKYPYHNNPKHEKPISWNWKERHSRHPTQSCNSHVWRHSDMVVASSNSFLQMGHVMQAARASLRTFTTWVDISRASRHPSAG